jgi:hypothetical protein
VLALLYKFVCSVEFFHFNPIRRSDGAGGDLPLEIVAAAARVEPLRIERGLTPARVASLAGFATLFLPCGEIPANPIRINTLPRCDWLRKGAGCVVPAFSTAPHNLGSSDKAFCYLAIERFIHRLSTGHKLSTGR